MTLFILALVLLVTDIPPELSRSAIDGAHEWVVDRHPFKRSGTKWSTPSKRITISRRERQDPGAGWSSQKQVLSTSFAVTVARARVDPGTAEISDLYVAGLYDNGTTVIERWRFTYAAPTLPGGSGYVPLENRPPPSVARSVIYMESPGIGAIKGLDVDPQNRLLILITHQDSTLYRVDIPAPHRLSVLLDPNEQPQLTQVKSVLYRRHATEGAKYILSEILYWKHIQSSTDASSAKTLLLSDPDGDGDFDTAELLNASERMARGYHLAESWHFDRTAW